VCSSDLPKTPKPHGGFYLMCGYLILDLNYTWIQTREVGFRESSSDVR